VALVRAIVIMEVLLESILMSRQIVVKFAAMSAQDDVISESSVGR
jgi:hypothetical protein